MRSRKSSGDRPGNSGFGKAFAERWPKPGYRFDGISRGQASANRLRFARRAGVHGQGVGRVDLACVRGLGGTQ
jgi:hypothetical protein